MKTAKKLLFVFIFLIVISGIVGGMGYLLDWWGGGSKGEDTTTTTVKPPPPPGPGDGGGDGDGDGNGDGDGGGGDNNNDDKNNTKTETNNDDQDNILVIALSIGSVAFVLVLGVIVYNRKWIRSKFGSIFTKAEEASPSPSPAPQKKHRESLDFSGLNFLPSFIPHKEEKSEEAEPENEQVFEEEEKSEEPEPELEEEVKEDEKVQESEEEEQQNIEQLRAARTKENIVEDSKLVNLRAKIQEYNEAIKNQDVKVKEAQEKLDNVKSRGIGDLTPKQKQAMLEKVYEEEADKRGKTVENVRTEYNFDKQNKAIQAILAQEKNKNERKEREELSKESNELQTLIRDRKEKLQEYKNLETFNFPQQAFTADALAAFDRDTGKINKKSLLYLTDPKRWDDFLNGKKDDALQRLKDGIINAPAASITKGKIGDFFDKYFHGIEVDIGDEDYAPSYWVLNVKNDNGMDSVIALLRDDSEGDRKYYFSKTGLAKKHKNYEAITKYMQTKKDFELRLGNNSASKLFFYAVSKKDPHHILTFDVHKVKGKDEVLTDEVYLKGKEGIYGGPFKIKYEGKDSTFGKVIPVKIKDGRLVEEENTKILHMNISGLDAMRQKYLKLIQNSKDTNFARKWEDFVDSFEVVIEKSTGKTGLRFFTHPDFENHTDSFYMTIDKDNNVSHISEKN